MVRVIRAGGSGKTDSGRCLNGDGGPYEGVLPLAEGGPLPTFGSPCTPKRSFFEPAVRASRRMPKRAVPAIRDPTDLASRAKRVSLADLVARETQAIGAVIPSIR